MRLDWEAQRALLGERVQRALDLIHKLFFGRRRSGRNDGGEPRSTDVAADEHRRRGEADVPGFGMYRTVAEASRIQQP